MLERDCETPVGGPNSPTAEDRRVDVVGQDLLAKARVRDHTADVAAAQAKILGGQFRRSQSVTKLPLASVQARVTPGAPDNCVVVGMRVEGLVRP